MFELSLTLSLCSVHIHGSHVVGLARGRAKFPLGCASLPCPQLVCKWLCQWAGPWEPQHQWPRGRLLAGKKQVLAAVLGVLKSYFVPNPEVLCEAWTRKGMLLLSSVDVWGEPALGWLQVRLRNGKPESKVRSLKEKGENLKILRASLSLRSLCLPIPLPKPSSLPSWLSTLQKKKLPPHAAATILNQRKKVKRHNCLNYIYSIYKYYKNFKILMFFTTFS